MQEFIELVSAVGNISSTGVFGLLIYVLFSKKNGTNGSNGSCKYNTERHADEMNRVCECIRSESSSTRSSVHEAKREVLDELRRRA